jgi:hypothetical protein
MRENMRWGFLRSDIGPFYFQGFTSTSVGLGYGLELFDLDC